MQNLFPGQHPSTFQQPQQQNFQQAPQGWQQPQQGAPQQGFQGFPGQPQQQFQRPQYQAVDPFAKLKDAAPSEKFPYFFEGPIGATALYVVQIVGNEVYNSHDGSTFFATRGKIVETQVPNRPVGLICKHSIKVTGNKKAMDNVKSYILGMLGIDQQHPDYQNALMAVDSDYLNNVVLGQQKFAGRVAWLNCKIIETKEKKQPFTLHDWKLKV